MNRGRLYRPEEFKAEINSAFVWKMNNQKIQKGEPVYSQKFATGPNKQHIWQLSFVQKLNVDQIFIQLVESTSASVDAKLTFNRVPRYYTDLDDMMYSDWEDPDDGGASIRDKFSQHFQAGDALKIYEQSAIPFPFTLTCEIETST